MKRNYAFIIFILLLVLVVVSPASASWPFDDITSWGNQVYSWIVGIPDFILSGVGFLISFAVYPIILFINLLYKDLVYLINSVVDFINMFIGMPKTMMGLFQTYTPSNMPTMWVTIFACMFSINAYYTVMQIIKTLRNIYQLIPAYLGGS